MSKATQTPGEGLRSPGTASAQDSSAPRPLALEDAFYRRVVDGMRCAILTVDRGGRVLTANRMAREILDIDGPDLGGMPVHEVLACHPRLAEVLLASLEMSHLPNRAEMEIRSREDDGRTIGFTISPILEGDATDGVALFFKDLTQVERLEEQDRLRDRLAALGQMAASMAHELRNPLASIDVTATLLRRRLLERGEDVALIDKITSDVTRLNHTVTRGLEFARPVAPERSEQRMQDLLETAFEEAHSRFANGEVGLVREFDADAPTALVDAQLMRQALVNLIENALEAMGARGTLTLRTRGVAIPGHEPGAIRVEIADDGPGIPAEVREKIFYPFVTTKEQGSGIGLAMARKIVECHHGLIDVADGPEGGTVFRLQIPCSPSTTDGAG